MKRITILHVRGEQAEQENGYCGINNIMNGVPRVLQRYFGYMEIVSVIAYYGK